MAENETNPDNIETQPISKVVPLSQKTDAKSGNPNPQMKKQAATADAPDVISLPSAIQTLADKVGDLMRTAEVDKIEVVGSKTYVNTAQRVYIFDTNGSLRIRSEFDVTPRPAV